MSDRIPTLDGPPLLLAEGGANIHAAHSGIEAFRLALRLGATAVGARAWLTADGQLAVAKDPTTGGLRRRRISSLRRDDLPEAIVTLAELYDACGPDLTVAVTVADDAAFDAARAVASDRGALGGLWIRHPDVEALTRWRAAADDVRLVNSVRLPALKEGPERRAATLRSAGIDAVEARAADWTGGLVALFHRFWRQAWSTDANYPEVIAEQFRMGLDAVGGDHPDRLVDGAVPPDLR